MQRVRLIGSIAVMTACLVAAGCGGSDDSASDSSSSADPAAAAEDSTASASDGSIPAARNPSSFAAIFSRSRSITVTMPNHRPS